MDLRGNTWSVGRHYLTLVQDDLKGLVVPAFSQEDDEPFRRGPGKGIRLLGNWRLVIGRWAVPVSLDWDVVEVRLRTEALLHMSEGKDEGMFE